MESQVQTLVGKKTFPAVSVILPVHPQYPGIKDDLHRLEGIVREVDTKLHSLYSNEKCKIILDKLKNAVNHLPVNHLSKTVVIYVSEEMEKYIALPFHVSEKVIIDNSFELRDLIYSAARNVDFMALIIAQNSVNTLVCNTTSSETTTLDNMPDNRRDVMNQHSLPGKEYADLQAFKEKNIHNYLHFIDEVISKELKNSNLPVVVFGDIKILSYFKSHTHNTDRIIGYVDGNYEHANPQEIRRRAEPVILAELQRKEQKALNTLMDAVSRNTFASGIVDVWRAIEEGRGKLLLVEKDYCIKARRGNDSFTILLDDSPNNPHNIIRDAVDDVIETILRKSGEVMFFENGVLSSYDRIALITHY